MEEELLIASLPPELQKARSMGVASFLKLAEENPRALEILEEPLVIVGYAFGTLKRLTHLSKHLYFVAGTGRKGDNIAAEFFNCAKLKTVESTFYGYVGFDFCGLTSIKDIKIMKSLNTGEAASFKGCKNLKIAEGHFPGYVDFSNSGVEEIRDLTINRKAGKKSASFFACPIKIAKGTFYGNVDFSKSEVEKIDTTNLRLLSKADDNGHVWLPQASFSACPNLKVAEGNFPNIVDFGGSGISKIGNLTLGECDPETGLRARFWNCENLIACDPKFLEMEGIRIDEETTARLVKNAQLLRKARVALKNSPSLEI